MSKFQLHHRFLLITVFISGMVSLGIEMAASRLLGNVFGTSNLVWASIIGLILIYLTVGYWLGGKIADRHPEPLTFYLILFWASLSIAIVPLISNPVLRLAASAFDHLRLGVLLGSFISVMILLVFPMVLLGMISPFAIRLSIEEKGSSGRVAGSIYAISTIGSFIGTFLATLLFIPLIGTYRTFMAFACILALTAPLGIWMHSAFRKSLVYLFLLTVLITLLILGKGISIKETPGQLFESESEYNYIEVVEEQGYFLLRLNEGQGVHSIYKPGVENYYGPWEQFSVAPFFNPGPVHLDSVKSMAIVGLAAGTAARAATTIYGTIQIDGFEIDPAIIDIGKTYFGMTEPNLNPIAADGRWGLDHSGKTYNIIAVDAYRPPYIPWHLTTREFFEIASSRLVDDGVLAINVGRAPGDRRLVEDLCATLRSVFPSVYVMDIPDTFNTILFATKQPTSINDLMANYQLLATDTVTPNLLMETISITVANMQTTPSVGRVYTDDLAPIEWVTNDMVVHYVLSE
jgi:spermidine synthase